MSDLKDTKIDCEGGDVEIADNVGGMNKFNSDATLQGQ